MIFKIIGVALGAAMLASGVTLFNGSQPYRVTGYFLSAEGVVERNDVVINGVPVGTVTKVVINNDSNASSAGAKITMEIQGKFAPLRRGTHAIIRPKGLLGNMFVQLDPGPQNGPTIPAGGTIPVQDTASPVTLDQVNDIFDASTRAKVKTATLEGGKAFQNRGQDINRLLSQLPAITGDTAAAAGKIDEKDRQLDALQAEFDKVAYQMAVEDQSLRNDLRNGASLLDTIAAHNENLKDELTYTNRSLSQLNQALHGHEKDLNALLKEMPALQADSDRFANASATSLRIINPCMSDVLNVIELQRSASAYDANGNMLRVYTVFDAAGNPPLPPGTPAAPDRVKRDTAPCLGARP